LNENVGNLTKGQAKIDTHHVERIVWQLPVRPYRTADNKIDGAVLTLVDINSERL
jgi:hypothetical protein